jgi:endoglucanase
VDEIEQLLKELTEASGVPGYEYGVRLKIKEHLTSIGEIIQDKMGSLICKKSGDADIPRVALVGHMDEIGFMVKHLTDEGFIKFTPLGGWWDQVLLSQRVKIKTRNGDVIGVIGAKPPHLLFKEEERKKIIEKRDMYIDIGAISKQEVEEIGVRIGDPIIPVSEFTILANNDRYMAKSFDDRVGCALTIAALKELATIKHPNTVYGVATVQEEVGLRGATTSVEVVNPDVAIILDVDIAGDVPGIKPEESSIKLGNGPSLLAYDEMMIPNLKLRDLVIDTAKEINIPLQISAMEGGATDGAPIHLHKSGVPSVVLAVPTRHIHSHNAIMHRRDFDQAVKLLVEIIKRLDNATVVDLTAQQ